MFLLTSRPSPSIPMKSGEKIKSDGASNVPGQAGVLMNVEELDWWLFEKSRR
jgi:hypothetical protein